MLRRHFLKFGVCGIGALAGCSDQSFTDSMSDTPSTLDVTIPWSQAPGPQGGPVTGIKYSPSDPTRMYAATPTAGVYYSSDAGASWTQGPSHMHHMGAVWASPHETDVARSTTAVTRDGGYTWEQYLIEGAGGQYGVRSITFDPLDQRRIYAGTTTGILTSTDGGATWTTGSLEIGSEGVAVRQLASATDGDSVVLWAAADNRVFRSRDRGKSWSVLPATRELPEQVPMGLVIERLEPERGYLALNGYSVYRIEDDDVRRISTDVPNLSFSGTPALDLSADGDRLFIVARLHKDERDSWTDYRLFTHDIFEESLRQLELPREPYSVVTHPESADTVTVGDVTGVMTSFDGGESWEDRSAGLIDSYLTAVAINETRPDTVLTGTECSGGLFVSHNQGKTWRWKRSGIPGYHEGVWGEHYVMHLAAHDDLAYATTASGLLISEDAGESWSMLQTDFSGEELTHLHGLAVHPKDPAIIYVGTGRLNAGGNPDAFDGTHLWKSKDGGESWRELANGFPTDADTVVQHIFINPHDPSTIFVGTNARDYLHGGEPRGEGLGLFKSTDKGHEWSSLDAPVSNITAVAVDGGSPERIYFSSTQGIYRSMDGGESWEAVRNSFSHGLVAHPDYPELIFASVKEQGRRVIVSTDGGDHWYDGGLEIQPGTTDPSPDVDHVVPYHRRKIITWLALDTSGDRLYAATQGAGLWQADVSDVTETVR